MVGGWEIAETLRLSHVGRLSNGLEAVVVGGLTSSWRENTGQGVDAPRRRRM